MGNREKQVFFSSQNCSISIEFRTDKFNGRFECDLGVGVVRNVRILTSSHVFKFFHTFHLHLYVYVMLFFKCLHIVVLSNLDNGVVSQSL